MGENRFSHKQGYSLGMRLGWRLDKETAMVTNFCNHICNSIQIKTWVVPFITCVEFNLSLCFKCLFMHIHELSFARVLCLIQANDQNWKNGIG